MNEELINSLRKLIYAPDATGRRIVSWYDEGGENAAYLEDIKQALSDGGDEVEVVAYSDNPLFVRHYVLREVPDANVIIYHTSERPEDYKDNQLLDIELSYPEGIFIPDESTLVLTGLDLTEEYRSVVRQNIKFFKNQKRQRDIKKHLPVVNPEALQMAIYAVLFEAEDKRLEQVLVAIFAKYRESREGFNKQLKLLNRDRLTELLQTYFGAADLELEDLDVLWESVVISYFKYTTEDIDFDRFKNFILPLEGNVRIFIRDLMRILPEEYERYAAEVSDKYGLDRLLEDKSLEAYIDSDAITEIDDHVISKLLEMLSSDVDISEYLRRREVGFYYAARKADYRMLAAANDFGLTVRSMLPSVKSVDKDTAISRYAGELYEVDMAYRHFNFYYDRTDKTDEYMNLAKRLEYIYGEEWMLKLAEKWEEAVGDESWTATKHPMLSEFYGKYLSPHDDKKDRVFVIVSDGLRYEVAQEIAEQQKLLATGGEIFMDHALTLLPSITPVGMAALLPHSKLEFDGSAVLADGMKTDASNRDKVLKAANKDNLAIKFEDLRSMKKSEWKSLFSGTKYVYIYHDKIDITGEHDDMATFAASQEAIREITDLVADLHTTFSGVNVLVTADHGFFYETGTVEARRKMPKVDGADKQKARYAITNSPDKSAMSFPLSDMFDGNDKYVNTPHSKVVFAKQGGVGRYYHGGALPQEVIVPILNFKSSRSTSQRNTVDITYSGITLKITNTITYLDFVQSEPVGQDKMAARYKVWFEDSAGEKISDEVTIIADSTESQVADRRYREKFVFAARKYSPEDKYFLVITDENGVEADRIEFKIDIAFANDLGL